MRRLCPTPAAVFALLISLPALAQFTVVKVNFTGGAPYTDAELLSATGLQPGPAVAEDALARAGRKLLDTGLFDDVQVGTTGDAAATTVEIALKPKPLATLFPASFENFVWFTSRELATGLHARVPLYRGLASDAGNLPEAIQTALQQMLLEKGVTAKLSRSLVDPTSGHPLRVINFKVEDPPVKVAAVHLTIAGPANVSAALATQPRLAPTKAVGTPYNEGLTGLTIEDQLLSPQRDTGHITAKLDGIQRTFAPADKGIGVTYTARVIPGPVYTVSNIAWPGTPIYSAADLARDAKLFPSNLSPSAALHATTTAISNAYLARGYIDSFVAVTPTVDDTAHTVAYALSIVPGEPYHVNTITATGLSPDAKQEFDHGFAMKTGDVYDPNYVANFLHNSSALQKLKGYTAGLEVSADRQTHLVDLTIDFVPPPATKEARTIWRGEVQLVLRRVRGRSRGAPFMTFRRLERGEGAGSATAPHRAAITIVKNRRHLTNSPPPKAPFPHHHHPDIHKSPPNPSPVKNLPSKVRGGRPPCASLSRQIYDRLCPSRP